MINFLKTYFIVFLIAVNLCNYSCKNKLVDCESYDYSGCNTVKPPEGKLGIKLTINVQNPAVRVKIFKGDFEDNNVIMDSILKTNSWDAGLPMNQYYSVAAYYKVDGKTVIAIDGDRIKLSSSVNCDSTCYTLKNGKADVRLKSQNL